MNQRRIVIDGKSYNSVDEMPPDVRAKYEQAMRNFKDSNQDGTPDMFEVSASKQVISNTMKYVVEGREYNNIDDLPLEARAKYEQAMGVLDKNKNGMPDILEGMFEGVNIPPQTPQNPPSTTSQRPSNQIPASPTISPDTSNGWLLVLAGIGLLALCVAGAFGVWYVFLR